MSGVCSDVVELSFTHGVNGVSAAFSALLCSFFLSLCGSSCKSCGEDAVGSLAADSLVNLIVTSASAATQRAAAAGYSLIIDIIFFILSYPLFDLNKLFCCSSYLHYSTRSGRKIGQQIRHFDIGYIECTMKTFEKVSFAVQMLKI